MIYTVLLFLLVYAAVHCITVLWEAARSQIVLFAAVREEGFWFNVFLVFSTPEEMERYERAMKYLELRRVLKGR